MSLQPHLVTPCVWLGTTHPCNQPHLWSVDVFTFLHDLMYKHCFLPVLLVSVMKCCVKMYCYLLHNPYCCSLPTPAYLYMYQLFTHCLPTIICVMLMSCVFLSYFCSVLCYCFFCFFSFVFYLSSYESYYFWPIVLFHMSNSLPHFCINTSYHLFGISIVAWCHSNKNTPWQENFLNYNLRFIYMLKLLFWMT